MLHLCRRRSVADPSPSKGFYIGSEDIKATRRIVLYPGKERYQLDPKTEVMPLEKLLGEVMTRGKHEMRRHPI
jgi:uncharacterized protein